MPSKKKPGSQSTKPGSSKTRVAKDMPKRKAATSRKDAEARCNADLKRSGLQRDRQRLGVTPLTEDECEKLTGKKRTGYVIPYFDTHGRKGKFIRVRFTDERKKGFSAKKPQRYWQPANTLPAFYLAPMVDWARIVSDTSVDIVITEGEKKAARACKDKIPTIGLGGVWSWRSKKQGELTAEPEIDDFKQFNWQGRKVVLAFDADVSTNHMVAVALDKLATHLATLGADVHVVDIPEGGLDDFLQAKNAVAFRQLPQRKHEPTPEAIHKLNDTHFVATEGGKTLVYEERHDPVFGRLLVVASTFEDFSKRYMHQTLQLKQGPEGALKTVQKGKGWLTHRARRQYEGIIMSPGGDVAGYYNQWRGFSVEPKRGRWDLFKDHMLNNLCSRNREHFEYLLHWLAHAVQHPERPGEVAIVLKGKQGTGKGFFARTIGKLFGQHFLHITSSEHLVGRFNQHLRDTILLFADEAFYAGDKQHIGVLKSLITEPTIAIEQKYRDVITVPNMLHVVMASNNDWVIPAGLEERRFFIPDVSDVRMQDSEYFSTLTKELSNGGLAALLYDLLNLDLTCFDVRHVPQTAGLVDQKLRSFEPVQSWWFEILSLGQLPGCIEGWGRAPRSALHLNYADFVRERGLRHSAPPHVFGKSLSELLPDGWPKTERPRTKIKATAHASRQYLYLFPSLKACRDHFTSLAKIGDYDWGKGDE